MVKFKSSLEVISLITGPTVAFKYSVPWRRLLYVKIIVLTIDDDSDMSLGWLAFLISVEMHILKSSIIKNSSLGEKTSP